MDDEIQKPLITTVIPTYRRPKLLRWAINSVLNQTYPHFQVCVYDNASGDKTADVVAELAQKDPRIKYHCHPKNIGVLKNFNYGMEHVDTPFFSFLSDDDILLPEFYQIALEGFEKHPEAIFSATGVICIYSQSNIVSVPILSWKTGGLYQPLEGLLAILKYGHPTWTGILFRREIIEKIGLLDQEVGAASDWDFELRAAAHFPFVISLKPGAIFVIHPGNIPTQIRFQDTWPGWLKIIRNLTKDEHIPSDTCIFTEHILTECLKKRLFLIGIRSILRRNDKDVYKAAEVFRNYYHQKTKAFLLYITAKICNYLPFIYCFFAFLRKIYRFLLWKKSEPLREKYREILSFYHREEHIYL